MVKLVSIVSNDPASKSTTYLADDGNTYTLKGDLSARANNPGNISPTGATAKANYEGQFGAIGYLPSSNGPPVAVFPDISSGNAAQVYLWQTPRYQNMTLGEAARAWAESPYIPALVAAAGVPESTKVSELTPQQLQAVVGAQTQREGSGNLKVYDGTGNAISQMMVQQLFGASNPTARPINSIQGPDDRGTGIMSAASQQLATLPSGKMIAPGMYPSSDDKHMLDVTIGQNGEAIIKKVPNIGEVPGLLDPINESPNTVAGGYIERLKNEAIQQGAAQAGTAIQNAGANFGDMVNNMFPGSPATWKPPSGSSWVPPPPPANDALGAITSGLGGAVSGIGSMFGNLFGGGQPQPSQPSTWKPPSGTSWVPKPASPPPVAAPSPPNPWSGFKPPAAPILDLPGVVGPAPSNYDLPGAGPSWVSGSPYKPTIPMVPPPNLPTAMPHYTAPTYDPIGAGPVWPAPAANPLTGFGGMTGTSFAPPVQSSPYMPGSAQASPAARSMPKRVAAPPPMITGVNTGNKYAVGSLVSNGNGTFRVNSNGSFTNLKTGAVSAGSSVPKSRNPFL